MPFLHLHKIESISTTNNNDSIALFVQREKASLAVQEHFMTLLSASAAKQIKTIQEDTKKVSFLLQARSSATSAMEGSSNLGLPSNSSRSETQPVKALSPHTVSNISRHSTTDYEYPPANLVHQDSVRGSSLARFQNMSFEEVNAQLEVLLGDLLVATERRNKIDLSTRRITERLMRFSSSTSSETVEGRISVVLQKRLAENLDTHLDELAASSGVNQGGITAEVDEDARLGVRDEAELSIDDELAEIEKRWAGWNDPDL